MSKKNVLSVKKLNKIYRKNIHALKDLNLEVKEGEIFGLLGPNGAGKSTFINILGGSVIKTDGEVNVWGFNLDKKYCFSNYNESGPPLGIMANTKYSEHTIPFDNSSMYIFTDGITEIKNSKGEMLGSEGFQNYIKKYKDKNNSERLKIIIDDILNSGHIQKDDLTIVAIDGK